jgi:hypothetical protein
MRDDRAGNCTDATSTTYSSAEATTRRYSVHTWATPASTAAFHTASTGGRGVLSIWTRTADTGVHPGRLCVVVRQMSTGTVLGSADFSLTRWPTDPSELAIAFDLQSASLPVGERLLVTLRTPKDSGADIQLLYDHPAYQSRLTLTTDVGKEFK